MLVTTSQKRKMLKAQNVELNLNTRNIELELLQTIKYLGTSSGHFQKSI